MSDAYSTLANFYDFSIGVDYDEWVEYLLALNLHYNHKPHRVLDLGCGTGNLTLPLARQGHQLTGVDISSKMVEVARAKAEAAGLDIPFYVDDMRNLDWSGVPFDTVISGCDVLNYLTTEIDLVRAFEAVHKLLAPGGFWFFDLNSEQKLRQVYGDESYADLQDDFAYFWDNSYDELTKICTMDLTFFVLTEEGLYERRTESHCQKLWTPQEVRAVCIEKGFVLHACHDFLSLEPHSLESERWQFVVEKK